MTHITLVLARTVVICVGALLMYIAFFLREDEEGKLQNRLEELWVQIDDLQGHALAKHTLFLKELLSLLGSGFDSLLGPKLFSFRSAVVTLCYSAASMSILIALVNATFTIGPPAFDTREFLKVSVFFVVFMAMGTSSIAIRRPITFGIWAGSSLLILIVVFRWATRPMGWRPSDQMLFAAALVGGIVCDLCFVAINRAIIRFSTSLQTTIQIAVMLACNMVIAFAYLAPLWLYPLASGFSPKDLANTIACTNLITALMACGIVMLMFVALLHRLFWPFMSRPIYAIARHGVIHKPAFLLSIAILLLTWAIPAWRPFWEELRHL